MQPTLTPAPNDAMANQVAAICQGWMALPLLFLTLSLPASPRRSRRPSTQRRGPRTYTAADRVGRPRAR
jgi:hypothetical protein